MDREGGYKIEEPPEAIVTLFPSGRENAIIQMANTVERQEYFASGRMMLEMNLISLVFPPIELS